MHIDAFDRDLPEPSSPHTCCRKGAPAGTPAGSLSERRRADLCIAPVLALRRWSRTTSHGGSTENP